MKIRHILFAVLSFSFLLSSCNPYQRITFSNTDFQKEKHVNEHIENYDVIVHNNESTYVLNNVTRDSSGISGVPTYQEVSISTDKNITDSEDEKNDIHLYLTPTSEVDFTQGNEIILKEKDIDHLQMYAKEDQGAFGLLLTLLIIIGAIFLGFILILVLAIASAGSGGSGESTSGDSNSGASDSGGSDSDSGCYVATMAYGDYDAPEVITLRQFRDRFLKKFGLGRAFISWYYRNSPTFVEKHRSKNWLHTILRSGLNVFVSFLRIFLPSK